MTNTRTDSSLNDIKGLGPLLCLVALIAVSFSIALRIEPAIMQNDIQRIFHLSPDMLSELVVRYQYSLIATLLFAGLIVDYIGPRTVLAAAIIAAMIGNYLFGLATTVPSLIHGRILIGYAHPFILISALKLGTLWLPKKRFAFFAGLLFAVLLMTPVMFKNILTHLVDQLGMTTFTKLFDLVGIMLVLVLALTKNKNPLEINGNIQFKDILAIIKNTKIWIICVISCLGWIANTFLLDYGMIFLLKNFPFTHTSAAETINTAFVCFALGAIFIGMLGEFLHEKRLLIAVGYLIAAISFSIALYASHLSLFMVSGLIFATGFFAGTAVICYAKAYDFCTTLNAGSAFALVAFITTLGNTLFTLFVGNLLQTELPHLQTSNSTTWQILLTLIPSALAIGAILALRLRKNEPLTTP